MKKPPVPVIVVSLILAAAGLLGLVYHFPELDLHHPFQNDALWIELVRAAAIVAGVYMLRGRNWARLLAMAWIALHVIVSAFHALPELIMHPVIFALFAYILFRPPANEYFQQASAE